MYHRIEAVFLLLFWFFILLEMNFDLMFILKPPIYKINACQNILFNFTEFCETFEVGEPLILCINDYIFLKFRLKAAQLDLIM